MENGEMPRNSSLLTPHCSLLPATCYLLPATCSFLISHFSLSTAHCSLSLRHVTLPFLRLHVGFFGRGPIGQNAVAGSVAHGHPHSRPGPVEFLALQGTGRGL